MRRIITAEDVLAGARDGAFRLQPGDLLSPLVHEVAQRHGIALVPAAPGARGLRVLLWRPKCRGQATRLAQGLEGCLEGAEREDRVVAVPFPWLSPLRGRSTPAAVSWAVFSVAAWDQGAYTGEVSARMAADMGATAAVLGVPEPWTPEAQRALLPRRVERALAHGLAPYVAVAPSAAELEGGGAFAAIRRIVSAVREAAAAGAERVRWFWCAPADPPPRAASAAEYVQMVEEAAGAPGRVGLRVAGGEDGAGAFRVEVAKA